MTFLRQIEIKEKNHLIDEDIEVKENMYGFAHTEMEREE